MSSNNNTSPRIASPDIASPDIASPDIASPLPCRQNDVTASDKANAYGSAASKLQWIANAFTSQARIIKEVLRNLDLEDSVQNDDIKSRLVTLSKTSLDMVSQATDLNDIMMDQEKMWLAKRTNMSPFWAPDGKRQLTYHELNRYAVSISNYAYHSPAAPRVIYNRRFYLHSTIRRMAEILIKDTRELEYKSHYVGYYPSRDELLLIVIEDEDEYVEEEDDFVNGPRHLYASIRPMSTYPDTNTQMQKLLTPPSATECIVPLNYPHDVFWDNMGFVVDMCGAGPKNSSKPLVADQVVACH